MFMVVIIMAYQTATEMVAFKPSFLLYYLRKQLYRISCGICKPAEYPQLGKKQDSSNKLNLKGLRQL